MKLTNSQLASAIMRLERNTRRTFDSERLLQRMRDERARRARACGSHR